MPSDLKPNLFGPWLRARRREAGVTQDELAERVGCSLITLQKIEAGERRPSRQMALLLASHLNIPVDEHEAFVTFARTSTASTPSEAPEAGQSPWRTAHRRHTNLPVALTALLGREHDEAAVHDLLLQTRTRLVTLVGPPGVGKTRLGLQVASGLGDSFEDGVFFVDLSPVLNPHMVMPTIARALGLREDPNEPIEVSLEAYLHDKKLLILLDNFEQVLDAAPTLASLLQSCPWIKVLVTSREALHVRGERRFNVPPLALPDLQAYVDTPLVTVAHLDTLASNPSIELFIERAQDVDQTFDLEEKNAQDLAAVCAGLDGLPLAIELAAARADTISLADMRVGLNSRLQLLSKGARDLPPRQRTLRNAVEWSYGLLSNDDRRTLEQTSVFAGGFTLDAASAVCDTPTSTHEHLDSLVSKSLIQRPDPSSAAQEPRFRYLETLREYAAERLEETGVEAEGTRLRHAQYFMQMAEDVGPRLNSNEQAFLMSRLLREHDNIRAALAWSFQPEIRNELSKSETRNLKSEIGIRLAVPLWRFWLVQGFVSEGHSWLSKAVSAAGVSLEATNSNASFEKNPYLDSLRQAFYGLGVLTYTRGDFTGAARMFNRSMDIAHIMGNPMFEASALAALSNVYANLEDYAGMRSLRERELVLRRQIGEPYTLASCLLGLCEAATYEGDYLRATELQTEAIAIFRTLGSKEGIGRALSNLSDIQLATHDYDGAWQSNEELLAIALELDQKEGVAFAHRGLGHAAVGQKRYPAAFQHFREGLLIFKKLESRLHILTCVAGIADVYYATGKQETAALLYGAVRSLRLNMGVPEQALPFPLEVDRLKQAFSEGSSLTLEAAMPIALGQPHD